MEKFNICGIDPGNNGGLTAMNQNGDIVGCIPMPTIVIEGKTKNQTRPNFNKVANFLKAHEICHVTIELVGAMPGQGVCSMFSFGFSTGGLHGACQALDIPVLTVPPRTWQKRLMGDDKHEKDDTINWVLSKYPNVNLLATPRSKKMHDGMSDSIGICYWSWLQIKEDKIIINKVTEVN